MASFFIVSLGCAKNLVDSEYMVGELLQAGWQMAQDPQESDCIIINTCGFIQPAVEEGIDEILSYAEICRDNGAKLVVVGCLVQRYRDSLLEELPEVDLFVGMEGFGQFVNILETLFHGTQGRLILPVPGPLPKETDRYVSTPFYRAWLKITEGCNNRCSYCLIPSIRGPLKSRQPADLVQEAKYLEASGVRELSIIAQDLTSYGNDLLQGVNLKNLLDLLLKETSIPWLRLLYLYPSGIDQQLIQTIAENDRITPYLDIPFQHVSNSVLKGMNRRYTKDDLFRLVENLRVTIPDISLRTTFLVGFPGETEQHVRELETFMREVKFDHLGIFPYYNEQGCPSENFSNQVQEQVRQERAEHLLEVQQGISAEKLKKYIGRKETVLVEGVSSETDLLLEGRTRYQAPEIDGCVYINEGNAEMGSLVEVEITEAQIYDLVGRII